MTWEEGVYKMTGLTAWRLGLQDRGLLREGFFADITVFDPETIKDRATFTDPFQYPEGIKSVFVNGRLTVHNGEIQDQRSGKVLRSS